MTSWYIQLRKTTCVIDSSMHACTHPTTILDTVGPCLSEPPGPGCVHNSGFSGSFSQAPCTNIYAISVMKYKLIIYDLHKSQTTI